MVVFGIKLLYSGKGVVFGPKRSYLGKLVVFWQKCLNSVKSGCIRVKMLCSGKVVVFGQFNSIQFNSLFALFILQIK